MKASTHSASDTRGRILEAAGEIFSESGFRNATVREICKRAGANIAAINYHFGEKEELYSEVLSHWYEFAVKKYPPLLGVSEDRPAEERLRAFVQSLLSRMLDKGKPAWFGKLMAREITEPTGAFDRLVEEIIRPLNRLLTSIVQEIIGAPVSEERLRFYCASIVSQCLYYRNARPVIARLSKWDPTSPGEIERIADHITRFSLNGLRGHRKDEREVSANTLE